MFDYEDARTVAMHRIQSTSQLEDAAIYPDGFSIDEAISAGKLNFGDGSQINLEAIFHHGAGDHLFETPISPDQKLTEIKDGSVHLTAKVADTPQLLWWILGLGDGVEILKPAKLRKTVQVTLSQAISLYGNQ